MPRIGVSPPSRPACEVSPDVARTTTSAIRRPGRPGDPAGGGRLVVGGAAARGESPLVSARSAYDRGAWEEAASRAREALRAAPSCNRCSPVAGPVVGPAGARRPGPDPVGPFRTGRSGGRGSLPAGPHPRPSRSAGRGAAQLWKAHDRAPSHGEAGTSLIRGLAREDALAKAVELAVALRDVPGWRVRGGLALGVLRLRKMTRRPRPRRWKRP